MERIPWSFPHSLVQAFPIIFIKSVLLRKIVILCIFKDDTCLKKGKHMDLKVLRKDGTVSIRILIGLIN